MPDQDNSNWQPVAASLARLIVRLWPEETQAWGRAFEAELSEIATPYESLRWLIGGLMLLTRERFKYFLRSLARPLGVPAQDPSSALSAGPAPRSPRLLTPLFLIVCVTFLCFSEVPAPLPSLLSTHIPPTTTSTPHQWT